MTSADFELPGPVVLERGDVARLVGDRLIGERPTMAGKLDVLVWAVQIGAITLEVATALIAELDAVAPGLVPCPTCGTDQAPRDGHMAVHFAARDDLRPCAGSWPVKVAAKGRAA